MATFTNLSELEAHLKKVFNSMMKSKEVTGSAKKSAKIMGESVIRAMENSPYNYDQTGEFKREMRKELNDNNFEATNSRVSFGFGYLDDLNDPHFGMRPQQQHTVFFASGKKMTVTTKPERQMPKWIIMEFGRDGVNQQSDKIPSAFTLPYTRRNKNALSPMSMKLVEKSEKAIERGKGPDKYKATRMSGGFFYKKGTFFMMTDATYKNIMGEHSEPIRHSGIRAGRFFRRGLESSQVEVYTEMGRGIDQYLKNN